MKIDRSQFEQILMNLFVNARDAMPDGGRIIVTTESLEVASARIPQDSSAKPGGYVVLKVQDSGCGMSEEVRSRIFEPFYTTKIDGQGTGLGLATIYGAVQQAGGFIEVDSESGKGSEFRVFLPEVHGEPASPQTGTVDERIRSGNETILLVEDEVMVRDLAVKLLSRWGYKVLQAAGGHEALELVEAFPEKIDLLVTDVVMPGMNGRQLAEKIVQQRPQMRVLYTSGYTEDVIAHSGVVEEGLNFI